MQLFFHACDADSHRTKQVGRSSMSVSSIAASVPQYQVPTTPQAKTDDERTESIAVKNREAATGKESAVPVQNKAAAVDMKV